MNQYDATLIENSFAKLRKELIAIRIENEVMRCELVALRKLIILLNNNPKLSSKELERKCAGFILEATATLDASCEQTNKLVRSALSTEKRKLEKN